MPRKVLTSFLLLVVFLLAGSIAMSCASRKAPVLGILRAEGGGAPRLTACPGTPNCVNSQEDSEQHGIAPLRYEDSSEAAMGRLLSMLESTPRVRITERAGDYIRAEFTTGLMRFGDDVEFLLLPDQKLIHVRSASRIGHSDLGANRKRVESLRESWSVSEEKTSQVVPGKESEMRELFRFDSEEACRAWQSIDDVVMGGRSRGQIVSSGEGTGVFRGEVSLENNGGFSSVRSSAQRMDLSDAVAIVLRLRGDGQIYQLRLRDEDGFDGVNHCAEFVAPAEEWSDVRIPLDSLEPRFRGRVLTDVPPLDRSSVRTLGLLIAEKQSGPFRLEIERISAQARSLES